MDLEKTGKKEGRIEGSREEERRTLNWSGGGVEKGEGPTGRRGRDEELEEER